MKLKEIKYTSLITRGYAKKEKTVWFRSGAWPHFPVPYSSDSDGSSQTRSESGTNAHTEVTRGLIDRLYIHSVFLDFFPRPPAGALLSFLAFVTSSPSNNLDLSRAWRLIHPRKSMAAEALLPPLLPTPPRSEMLPLLPTPHGLVLTMLVSAMAGRADFVDRWDWNKKGKKPCSSICSSSSSSSEGSGSTGHADSVERWDWNKKCKRPCGSICSSSSASWSEGTDSFDRWGVDKKYKKKPHTTLSSSSSLSYRGGNPGRADSVERWDSKKKLSTSCSASLPTDRGRHDDGNNKRLPSPSRASSAERWDLHKKPRPEQTEKLPRTMKTPALATTPQKAMFAGPNFHASPDPSMLPMPPFFLLARSRALCTSH